MKEQKMKGRIARLLAPCLCVMCVAPLVACGENATIDVPNEMLEAYVGEYEIPDFEVVNSSGEILTWYSVAPSKVTGPDKKSVEIEDGVIEVETPGVYTITLEGKGVKKASYKVNFAYEPPLVSPMSSLPKAYLRGAWYPIPQFRFENADVSKSEIKLYYRSEKGVKTELPLLEGGFTGQADTGEYIFVVRAVSFLGVEKEYEFVVKAGKGTDNVVSGKIAYFDEEFGVSQVTSGANMVLSYSTDYAYGSEAGSLKVEFGEFNPGASLVYLTNLIEGDVSEYTHLVFRVYNPNPIPIYAGYAWFGDTPCPSNQWTEVKWPIAKGFPNSGASVGNLTGLAVRLFRYTADAALMNDRTVYVSAIYAITE